VGTLARRHGVEGSRAAVEVQPAIKLLFRQIAATCSSCRKKLPNCSVTKQEMAPSAAAPRKLSLGRYDSEEVLKNACGGRVDMVTGELAVMLRPRIQSSPRDARLRAWRASVVFWSLPDLIREAKAPRIQVRIGWSMSEVRLVPSTSRRADDPHARTVWILRSTIGEDIGKKGLSAR